VAEVSADGTVTLPEAREVRAIEHQGRPEHRKPRGERTPEQGQRLASRCQRPDDRSPPGLSLRARSRWWGAARAEGQNRKRPGNGRGGGEPSTSGRLPAPVQPTGHPGRAVAAGTCTGGRTGECGLAGPTSQRCELAWPHRRWAGWPGGCGRWGWPRVGGGPAAAKHLGTAGSGAADVAAAARRRGPAQAATRPWRAGRGEGWVAPGDQPVGAGLAARQPPRHTALVVAPMACPPPGARGRRQWRRRAGPERGR
jgi:hypothetical protein